MANELTPEQEERFNDFLEEIAGDTIPDPQPVRFMFDIEQLKQFIADELAL